MTASPDTKEEMQRRAVHNRARGGSTAATWWFPLVRSRANDLAVRSALAAGDARLAANVALDAYGAETFGFLLGAVDDTAIARRAYASFRSRALREISLFAFRCSIRTWLYGLAWSELARARTEPAHDRGRKTPSISLPEPTTTVPNRLVIHRSEVADLRRALLPLDRDLLILRIDRRLGWGDLAFASLGADASPGDVAREARRLRERLLEIRRQVSRVAAARRILPSQE